MAYKILIVEDDPEIIEFINITLNMNKYDVIEATTGKEALQKITTEKPDLILMDIMLPELDGFSTVMEIRKNQLTKNIPIIVITAKSKIKELFEIFNQAKINEFIENLFQQNCY